MCCAIFVTSVTPYLLNTTPGSAGLAARVGWFFAASSFILFLYGIFVIPELKGRSLEEVGELFEARIPAWKFFSYITRGAGAKLTAFEAQDQERVRKLSFTKAKAMRVVISSTIV